MTVKSSPRALLLIVASLLATPVAAQQPLTPPPPFVPFTISQSDYQAIQNWLGEQPAKFAIPVLTWLKAQERKAQDEAKKAVSPPAPAPEGAK